MNQVEQNRGQEIAERRQDAERESDGGQERLVNRAVDHRLVGRRLASDHWPVVADVVAAPSRPE